MDSSNSGTRKMVEELRVARNGSVALLFANGIGDHIITLPALRAACGLFGDRITVIGIPELYTLFYKNMALKGFVPVRLYRQNERYRFDPEPVIRGMREVDIFLSLNPWHSTDVDRLLLRLKPKLSVGMAPCFGFATQPEQGEHSCDRAFRLIQRIEPAVRIDDYAFPLHLSMKILTEASLTLASVGPNQRILAVHNETLTSKCYSPERFAKVVDVFLSQNADFTAVAVGKVNEGFDSIRSRDRFVLTSGIALEIAFGLVAQADLFLGVDSCMLHMADISRVPGVGLFGPAPLAPLGSSEMGFRFGPHVHLTGHGKINRIMPEDAVWALNEMRRFCSNTPRRFEEVHQEQSECANVDCSHN